MDPTNPQYKIRLCADCGLVLSDLVSLYIKFMSFTTAESELAKLIHDTSLWTFNKHCHQLQEEGDQEIEKQCYISSSLDDDDDHTITEESFASPVPEDGNDKYNDDANILDMMDDDIKIEVDEEGHIILPYLSEEYYDLSPSNTTEGNGELKKNLVVRLERLNPNEIKSLVSKKPSGQQWPPPSMPSQVIKTLILNTLLKSNPTEPNDDNKSITRELQRISSQLSTSRLNPSSSTAERLARIEIRRRERCLRRNERNKERRKQQKIIRTQQKEILKAAKQQELLKQKELAKLAKIQSRQEKAREKGKNIKSYQKNLSCPHCDATNFKYYSNLSEHLKTVHSAAFPCKYCAEAFSQELFLVKHMNKVHPEIKKWRECSFCHKTFTIKALREHILSAHIPGFDGFTCKYCAKSYTTNSVLNGHILKFHAQALLADAQENQSENTDAEVDMKQQPPETQQQEQTPNTSSNRGHPNYCKTCALKFPTKLRYLAHKALKHPKVKKLWSCTLCDKSLGDRPRLRNHYKVIHKMSLPSSLEIQVNQKTNNDDRSCDVCGKLFAYPSEVKSHKEDKHSNNPEKPKPVKVIARNRPVKTKYKVKAKENICKACVRGFKDLFDLKIHVETWHHESQQCKTTIEDHGPGPSPNNPTSSSTASAESDYQPCTKCSEENTTRYFINNFYLQRHNKLTHDKQNSTSTTRPNIRHVCAECGKGYRWLHNYKAHLENEHSSSNSNSKISNSSFQCDECGKCFRSNAGLQLHLSESNTRHEVNRQMKFQCVDCNTWYLSEKSYAAHVQLHRTADVDQLQRNRCKVCGKVFHLHGHLKRHMKETHAPPGHCPYICQLCGKGFKGAHLLKAHLNTKGHGGPGEPPRKRTKRVKSNHVIQNLN